MGNILITGRPGVGKTTLVKKIVGSLKSKGKKVGGFYTEEIRKESARVGFKIKTLDGKEGILSHKDFKSPFRVGKYHVNVDDLEKVATTSLETAIDNHDIIIIDEIAKMELFSNRFKKAVLKALGSPKDVIATLQGKPNKFIDSIKKRKDAEIFKLTVENRDSLAEGVVEKITGGK